MLLVQSSHWCPGKLTPLGMYYFLLFLQQMHTHKSILDLVKSNQIWIVITFRPLIWPATEPSLVKAIV